MSKFFYGNGEPTSPIVGYDYYVDLETDTMYQFTDGVWVVHSCNGVAVGDEYLYGY